MKETFVNICDTCCFHDDKYLPVFTNRVHPPIKIMFIGENPSWAEGQEGPFSLNTNSGEALDKYYLTPLDLTRDEVWITDLIKCRYPKEEPNDIYHHKLDNDEKIQETAEKCCNLWLVEEIVHARPKVIVTLSDKEVYQRFRKVFKLKTPAKFADAIGKPFKIEIAGHKITLFPMIHPDISRPKNDSVDKRKLSARRKWAEKHRMEHIPRFKKLFACLTL